MDSDMVAEVEAVCGVGSCDPGETAYEDGGFSSMIGDVDTD